MKNKNIIESIRVGCLLAVAGGFMDTYSYLVRDHVFANAQTGNIILLGINISEKNFSQAVNYLFPILAFTLGVAFANFIKFRISEKEMMDWRQISLLLEAMVLFSVAFIPIRLNLIANSLTSFSCAMQVESFRQIRGNSIATTMCIGNLRSATQHICDYFHEEDFVNAKRGLLYYTIILFFVFGAIIGKFFIDIFDVKAIIVCSIILIITDIIIHININGFSFNKK